MSRFGVAAYAAVSMETGVAAANSHRLVLMLFEATLVAVHRAAERMRARDIATKGAAISKAIELIECGLIASLDDKTGGELARRLRELYRYMIQRLLLASVRNDPAGLDEVARLLNELKEAWATIEPKSAEGGKHG